jgi:hypothetical protein
MRSLIAATGLAAVVSLVACDAPPPEPTATSAKKDPATTANTGTKPGPATTGQGGGAKPQAKGPFPESTNPAMKDPSLATEKAPDSFDVKFDTTAGEFLVECKREWAPASIASTTS